MGSGILEPIDDGADLAQGHILQPTAELNDLFSRYHPYFEKAQYFGFLVLTHSCDLERRGDDQVCSAGYISIAPIRPLRTVLHRLLKTECKPVWPNIEGAYRSEEKYKAENLLTRIINQNEQKLGLFFIPAVSAGSDRDVESGFGEECVAFLRVSVAFKREHYTKLARARTCALAEPFRSKLGWLVGNLYNRIGTPDMPKRDLRSAIASFLSPDQTEEGADDSPIWIKKAILASVRSQNPASLAEAREIAGRASLLGIGGDSDLVREIIGLLTEAVPRCTTEEQEAFRASLASSPVIKSLLER